MPRLPDVNALCALIRPGERVFLSSATGEPIAIVDAWLADPEAIKDVELITSFVPGVNPLPIGRFHPDTRVTGLFMHPGLDDAARDGRFRHLPLSYAGFVRHIRSAMELDTLIVHVAPPDANGRCSLGPTVEFVPELLRIAKRVLAVVNPAVPSMSGSVSIPLDRFEAWCEAEAPLRTYATDELDPLSAAVGLQVASWIEDETTIQVGIGKVPTALLSALRDRRRLRFHSGLVSDGLMALDAAGALADNPSLSCALLGGPIFYDWLRDRGDVAVRGCEVTHDATTLAGLKRFAAINSAIEVDLSGQASLEAIGARRVSSVGGAPDFAHAASLLPDGLSIVALPSASPKGQSRIVARLGEGIPVSLPRQMVDIIVTEHGSADLRGKSTWERAEAIAAIAAPAAQSNLITQWRDGSSQGNTR